MSQSETQRVIDRLVRRLRRVRALGDLVRFALAVAALVGVALVVDKLIPLSSTTWQVVLAVSALVVLAGVGAGLARGVSRLAAARLADRRFGLDDRLSNAVAFLALDRPTPFMQAHLRETSTHLDAVQPQLAVPFRLPKGLALLGLAVVALGLLIILPGFARSSVVTTPADEAKLPPLHFAAEETASAALRRLDAAGDKRFAAIVRELKRFYAQVRAGELSRSEALKRAGEIDAQLTTLEDERTRGRTAHTWRAELEKAVAETGKTLQKHPAAAEIGGALRDLKLDEAGKNTRSLAERLGGKTPTLKLTPEQSKALAKLLEHAAGKNRRTLDVLSKHMNDAARSLSREDMKTLAEDLERMARDIERLKKDADDMRDLARLDGELEEIRDAVAALRRDGEGKWTFNLARGDDGAGAFFELSGEFPKDKRSDTGPGVGDDPEGPGTGGPTERIDATKKPSLVSGKWGDGAGLIEIVRGAATEGVATAAYADVADAAARLAEHAVHAEDIPLGYRLYIKRYFRRIRPPVETMKETP